MNDLKKEKLKRFVSDTVMSEAVFDVLLDSFIRPKPSALVNEQAASYIAIGLLQDSWRELEKYRNQEQEKLSGIKQVGL